VTVCACPAIAFRRRRMGLLALWNAKLIPLGWLIQGLSPFHLFTHPHPYQWHFDTARAPGHPPSE